MLFIFILLILIMLAFFQPRWLFKLVEKIAPGVKYFAETEQPIVALTIDDGLHWQTTPKILATLKKYQAHATFFLISERIPSNELIFEQIIQNGHEIGNHMVRDEKSIDLSLNEFEVQLLEADSILSKLVNKHSRTSQGIKFNRIKWFRPGGGWYNQKMIDIAQKYGYQSVLGSIFPYDTHIPSAKFATCQILLNLRPGDIIILHDSSKNGVSGEWGERTIKTLEAILPEIKRRGFQTVILSQMFGSKN